MQDSLRGNGKTLMVVNVAPGEASAGETLCSLQFAARVRGVELGPMKRSVENGSEIMELKEEILHLKAKVSLGVKPSYLNASAYCGMLGA